jgi:hypothetical protein
MHLAGQEINRAVVSLSLPFIGDGHFDGPIAFAPYHATDIAPPQMTFVLHQDYQLSPLNLVPLRRQFFLISSRRTSTCPSSRWGFTGPLR